MLVRERIYLVKKVIERRCRQYKGVPWHDRYREALKHNGIYSLKMSVSMSLPGGVIFLIDVKPICLSGGIFHVISIKGSFDNYVKIEQTTPPIKKLKLLEYNSNAN